jgi:photosystem II stability/assembly factor-like uncharacterized protein
MNESRWRELYRPLGQARLPDEARHRIRASLLARPGKARASTALRPGLWWLASGAVAVALVGFALASQALRRPPATAHGKPPAHVAAPRELAASSIPITTIDMTSASSGWALGNAGQVLRTDDAGRYWAVVTPRGVPKVAPYNLAITAFDRSHAWFAVAAQSDTLVYRTADGGASWQRSVIRASGGPQLRFYSPRRGYIMLSLGAAAGSEGILLLSTADGGGSWRIVGDGRPTPQEPSILFGGDKSGFGFADALHGFITGEWAADSILLDATSDGGRHWSHAPLAVPAGLTAQGGSAESLPPAFFGASDGVMPVQFFNRTMTTVFYRTQDGGATWTPTTPVQGAQSQLQYSIVDPLHIVATDGQKVFTSADGGQSWVPHVVGKVLGGVTALDFTNPRTGWALAGAKLLRTTDGGLHWTVVR